MGTSVLDREMFTEAEAARLLRISQSTLHWWLDGGTYHGRTYRPVIRVEPRGERSVTWAEFVEAGLLREYRRTHKVALAQLRTVIDRLRERYDVPYPLAHYRPFVGPGRQLLLDVQREAGLDAEVCPVETFVQRVQWADDIAVGWRPHDDPASPVRMSPDIRFGRPAVGGISTVVLWEHLEGGDSVAEVAETFDLHPAAVRWAYAYEAAARVA